METELASEGIIESYLTRFNAPKGRGPTTRLRGGLPKLHREASVPRERKRCLCGECVPCIENARWERIFNEKFADPNYYRPRPAPLGSSLNSRA